MRFRFDGTAVLLRFILEITSSAFCIMSLALGGGGVVWLRGKSGLLFTGGLVLVMPAAGWFATFCSSLLPPVRKLSIYITIEKYFNLKICHHIYIPRI